MKRLLHTGRVPAKGVRLWPDNRRVGLAVALLGIGAILSVIGTGLGETWGTRALYAAIPLVAVGFILIYSGARGETTDANG